ncbi:MAG TPA: response regulator transcription factor [Acidimicrobiales bacterium]|nr:response regulator transcription factor [Acidimicrobiales bacterium]
MDGASPSGEGPTITICDRQPVFAEGLATLLQSEPRGYRVLTVTTSPTELELPTSSPDVVLLDASFGLETVARVCAAHRDASVILLGTDEDQVDLPGALHAGARAYVLKNDKASDMCEVIDVVMRDYSVVPSSALRECVHTAASFEQLTATERAILSLLTRGSTNREIANALHFSERTVRRYLLRIYSKLCVADRIQAALYAVRSGLVSVEEVTRLPGNHAGDESS